MGFFVRFHGLHGVSVGGRHAVDGPNETFAFLEGLRELVGTEPGFFNICIWELLLVWSGKEVWTFTQLLDVDCLGVGISEF